MAKKLIKKLNNREFYAKYSDYAAMDEHGERISDRKVKTVSLDAASGTMTVTSTDGSQEIPVVPVPDQEGKVLKSNADGTYAWGAAGAEPGSGKLYVKFGSAPEVYTNFNANSDSKVTLAIPLASAVEGNEEDGLMSSEDKGVLDGLPDKIGGLDDRIITIEHDYVTSQGLQTALSPIVSDINSLGGQVGSLDQGKADKVSPATSGNLASLDAGGDLADSGISGTAVSDALTTLGGIEPGAQVNVIDTVQLNGTEVTPSGKTVNIQLDKSSVGLGNVENTSDLDKPISNATQSALDGKADKSAMSISDVSGDSTKKTIQLKEGLTQDVVVDVSGKQDSLPQSSANQYLITDSNNALAWGNIPTIEPAKVHILSKTRDFTLSEFDEIWNWLENGHIVGVYRRMQFAMTDMDCLYLARQRYTNTYGRTIAFVFDKVNTDWDNNDNSALVAYLGLLVWNTNYSKNSISFIERTMIPDPTNNQNKFLFCNGSAGFSYVPAFRVTASGESSFSALSGTSNILNVNSSRGYLGAGTSLHKYLMLDESNVTDASDDGKLVTLDYNNGNFKLGLSSVNSVPTSTSADEGKLLSVNSQGNASWTSLTKSSWGTVITDGDNALADENGNLIFDENETELWTSFNNVGFGAERAVADVEGNDIIATYAKKSEVPDGLPSTTGASNGDVLTVNNGAATWAAPGGGGGDDAVYVVLGDLETGIPVGQTEKWDEIAEYLVDGKSVMGRVTQSSFSFDAPATTQIDLAYMMRAMGVSTLTELKELCETEGMLDMLTIKFAYEVDGSTLRIDVTPDAGVYPRYFLSDNFIEISEVGLNMDVSLRPTNVYAFTIRNNKYVPNYYSYLDNDIEELLRDIVSKYSTCKFTGWMGNTPGESTPSKFYGKNIPAQIKLVDEPESGNTTIQIDVNGLVLKYDPNVSYSDLHTLVPAMWRGEFEFTEKHGYNRYWQTKDTAFELATVNE